MKKVLIWDIETTNLDADFGTILCIGYKWLDESKTHVISITDYPSFNRNPTDDKGLVRDFLKVYNEADLTIAYNGILFDRPYLIAKILEHKLPIPPNIPMQDPYWTVKSNLRISRKSLENVSIFAQLAARKSKVDGRIWKRAATGHKPSLNYIVTHCVKDVQVLEEAYLTLRPLMRTHHRLSEDLGHCRYCNSDKLQSRGKAVSKVKGVQRRIQCQACGGWDTRTEKEMKQYAL